MAKQKSQILECIDGRCPPDIDLVKEIVLSPLEKRAIFFSLRSEIERTLSQRAAEKTESERVTA